MKPVIAYESLKPELRGVMAIQCRWCMKITKKGDPRMAISHTICPECYKVYAPEFLDGACVDKTIEILEKK